MIVDPPIVGWSINDAQKSLWKEVIVACLRYYLDIFAKRLRITDLSQDIWVPTDIRIDHLQNTSQERQDLEVSDYRRGMGWWTELLTSYTHHSELQVITGP
jgi:hypothetical protein